MKKWMAMLLTLCMLMSLVPMTALAAELTLEQPVAVVQDAPAPEEPEEEAAEEAAEEEPAEEPAEEAAEEAAEEPAEEPAEESLPESGEAEAAQDGAYGSRGSSYDHVDVKLEGHFDVIIGEVATTLSGEVDADSLVVKVGSRSFTGFSGTRTEDGLYEYTLNLPRNNPLAVSSIAWMTGNYGSDDYWRMFNVYITLKMYLDAASVAKLTDDIKDVLGTVLGTDDNGTYVQWTEHVYEGYQQCTGGNGMRFDPDGTRNSGTANGLDLYIDGDILTDLLTGEITIAKALVDEDGGEVTDTETSFTFYVLNENDQHVYFVADSDETGVYNYAAADTTGASAYIYLKGGQTAVLKGLPAGSYSVTEVQSEGDGYTLGAVSLNNETVSSTADNAASDTVELTVSSTAENKVTFTNEKMENTGSGALRKVAQGDQPAGGYPTPTVDIYEMNADATALVDSDTSTAATDPLWTGTLTPNGSHMLWSDQQPGYYFIVESNAEAEGYDLSATATATNDHADPDSAETLTKTTIGGLTGWVAEVVSGDTIWVRLTNDYSRNTGSLTITKTVVGDLSALPAGVDPVFTITGPGNYSKTVNYSDFTNGSYTITDLPTGTYTVAETGADVTNYTLYTIYSVTGGQVAVTANQTAALTVTNNYVVKTGDLTITKSVTGTLDEDELEALAETLVIHVWKDGEVIASVTPDTGTVNNTGGWTWTVTGLPYGTYTIQERGYDVAHHDCSVTINGTVEADAAQDVTVNAATQSVTVTNTYGNEPLHVIDIPFEKVVEVAEGSPIAGYHKLLFEVDLPGDWTGSGTYNGQGGHWLSFTGDLLAQPAATGDTTDKFCVVVDANDIVDGTVTISGTIRFMGTTSDFERLLALQDSTIVVRELESDNSDWTRDETEWNIDFAWKDPNAAEENKEPVATVTKAGETTPVSPIKISFKNTYDWTYGSVTVTKTVLGRTDDSTEYEVEITVIRPENSDEMLYGMYSSDNEDWTVLGTAGLIYGLQDGESLYLRLPAGWNYTVEEIVPEDADFDVSYKVNGSSVDSVTGAAEEGETTAVVVYNDYSMTVDVAKYWLNDGLEDNDHAPVQVQLYTLLDDGETWAAYGQPVSLNSENNWYYVWQGLPEGSYTVDELNVPEGYRKTVEDVTEEVNAPEFDVDFAFDITNEKLYELSFTIEKTVELGGNAEPGETVFEILMWPEYAEEAARYGGVEYWCNGEKLEDEGGFYVVPITVTGGGTVSATVTMKGTEDALYWSDVNVWEYIPGDLAAEWSYDESIFGTYADYDDDGRLCVEIYEAFWDEEYQYYRLDFDHLLEKISFTNTYTKNETVTPPGDGIVKTGDSRAPFLWALMTVFAAGGLGLTAVLRRKKNRN